MSPPIGRLERNVDDEPPVADDPGGVVTLFVLALIATYIRFIAMIVLGLFIVLGLITSVIVVVYRYVHSN